MHQLPDIFPVIRVFLQAAHHQVLCLVGDLRIGRECDRIFYYLYQLFLLRNFEWVLPSQHFIKHDTQ